MLQIMRTIRRDCCGLLIAVANKASVATHGAIFNPIQSQCGARRRCNCVGPILAQSALRNRLICSGFCVRHHVTNVDCVELLTTRHSTIFRRLAPSLPAPGAICFAHTDICAHVGIQSSCHLFDSAGDPPIMKIDHLFGIGLHILFAAVKSCVV